MHIFVSLRLEGAAGRSAAVEVAVAFGLGVMVAVGVGGMATVCNALVSPVTVEYCPHSQQVPLPFGILMIQ